MNTHNHSLHNNSIEFVLDLSRDKISNRGSGNRIFNDDLEYSLDGSRISNIIEQFKRCQYDNGERVLQGVEVGTNQGKQVEKKRQRKMIFQKPSQQKNIGVAINQVKLSSGGSFEQIRTQQQMVNSKMLEQVEAFPVDSVNINRMASPPQLPRDSQIIINNSNIPHNRISYQSVGGGNSFIINDSFNGFIGSGNNLLEFSRDSKAMQVQQNIFNSRTSYNDRNSIISNMNVNQNILQELKLSEIKINESQDNIILSQANLVESQEANNFKKDKQISKVRQHPDYINVSGYQTPASSRINQPQSNISNQSNPQINSQTSSQIRLQPHNIQQLRFQKPTQTPSQIKRQQQLQQNILLQDSIIKTSQISIQSNIKSSTHSSNLMSSDSLNRALGNLEQHTFLQPILQSRMPQLLQQSHRLNSISINFLSPDFLINSIRHKQIIRNLIFQQLSATQVLQKFQQDLESRQIKHNNLFKQFNQNAFLQGDWYDIFKIKYNIIRPVENPPKRTIDFNRIKQTLKNSTDALTYLQNYVENLKIQPSQQFKKVYINIRTSLFQLLNNLNKISQDLYVKSTTRYLPQHFYTFYQCLQTASSQSSIKLSADKVNTIIDKKQQILLEIRNLKKKKDPLACSKVAEEIQKKLINQLNFIKSVHNDVKGINK